MAKKPAPAPAVSSDEAVWRARSDADTLANAGEIMADKARHQAAMSHVQKKVAGMQRIMGAAPAAPSMPAKPRAKAPSLGFAKKGR